MESSWMRYLGIALSVLVILFLAMDAGMKIISVPVSIAASGELGFQPDLVPALGWILAIATILYAVPRTSLLGAILLTGYFGGAIATQLQHGSPIATHVLFGVYLGALAWAGLWLRSSSLRAALPVRR
jgi:DoxX-like family